MEDERRRLLASALAHVPHDGWSEAALLAAAADVGMAPDEARRCFPGGASDMVALFHAEGDARMEEALADMDLEKMRVRDRISTAVRLRLLDHAENREALRRAVTYLSLPGNIPLGLKCAGCTVDAMWRAVGDTSTDINYYTKRALLLGVFSTTMLYWLGDDSDDFSETWAFLDRRIGNVMQIMKARGRVDEMLGSVLPANI